MWLNTLQGMGQSLLAPKKNYLAQNVTSLEAEIPRPTPRPVGSTSYVSCKSVLSWQLHSQCLVSGLHHISHGIQQAPKSFSCHPVLLLPWKEMSEWHKLSHLQGSVNSSSINCSVKETVNFPVRPGLPVPLPISEALCR